VNIARIDEVLAHPDVLASIERSRAAIDAVRWHDTLRRHSAEVVSEAIVRGAWASARCEGVEISLDEVRAGSFDALAAPDSAVVNGAIRATQATPALVPVWQRAPLQALARMHALAAAGLVDTEADRDMLGRPRAARADERDAPSRALQELASWAHATSVPALVVYSVVTGELLRLAPFGRADAMVARAIGRVLIAAHGLDDVGVTVPEYGWMTVGPSPGDLDDRDDLVRWIDACADVLVAGADEGRRICEDVAAR
jgi:hypothetical protein